MVATLVLQAIWALGFLRVGVWAFELDENPITDLRHLGNPLDAGGADRHLLQEDGVRSDRPDLSRGASAGQRDG